MPTFEAIPIPKPPSRKQSVRLQDEEKIKEKSRKQSEAKPIVTDFDPFAQDN